MDQIPRSESLPTIKEIFLFLKNKDFLNTTLNYGWALISGPITLIFIPLFLTNQLQGYYYAFSSVSALSILAELGFSNIVLQFAAHEFAFLSFKDKQLSFEDPSKEIHLKKLASLFRFSVKWILVIIGIAFPGNLATVLLMTVLGGVVVAVSFSDKNR